ncbi:hypothetical protein LWI29_000718 [Acer saccharum]|uniref:MULE transposase domain-containing protein n=1 Tax=Acer saccharum TaxID=4024 RepID=A0AA39RBJ1_ACESA|nr:hypothetical protein LWI29_000718 [Acer saccharum]
MDSIDPPSFNQDPSEIQRDSGHHFTPLVDPIDPPSLSQEPSGIQRDRGQHSTPPVDPIDPPSLSQGPTPVTDSIHPPVLCSEPTPMSFDSLPGAPHVPSPSSPCLTIQRSIRIRKRGWQLNTLYTDPCRPKRARIGAYKFQPLELLDDGHMARCGPRDLNRSTVVQTIGYLPYGHVRYVNYDGVWEDVDFNPKTIFLLAVTPKDTLKTLSDKICDLFGLNCDAVDMKFSTLLSGTVVEMSFDADFQIFISHNKKILNVTFRCFTILYRDISQRPVVSIDATHLTGSVKGVLLIASAKDGDSKIYPLAFGFAPSECKGSWTWFLSELKKGIGSPQDLVIVSDRHRGIISEMKKVFPDAQHAFCVFHIA